MSKITYNVDEARISLSELIDRASNGEEIILSKGGKPLAKLVPLNRRLRPREPGGREGRVQISEDFDTPLAAGAMDVEAAQRKLTPVARYLSVLHADKLKELKAKRTDLDRPDFLWHYLLQSFATMGRAAAWKALGDVPARYDRVRFERLASLSAEEREREVQAVCREAGLRMPSRKAQFILGCFDRIMELGGPSAARAKLLELSGKEKKLEFLDALPGIGPKYARNIMMDVYHEDFRESIAIDVRISKVTELLGLQFASYAEEEQFYLSVADLAGIEGWELDRLLFNYLDEVSARLRGCLEGSAVPGSARQKEP